eukprot:67170-Rhodomonas_salina.1
MACRNENEVRLSMSAMNSELLIRSCPWDCSMIGEWADEYVPMPNRFRRDGLGCGSFVDAEGKMSACALVICHGSAVLILERVSSGFRPTPQKNDRAIFNHRAG